MRKLYGSTSWRRVLALVLVFVMMLSTMGTSGYSVFAEDLSETGEEVVVSEPEAVVPEVTEDIQGPSPGEEAEEVTEPVLEAEEGEELEEAAEAVEETEEGEELEEAAEAVEETEEGEETEEPAEAAEEAEEGEEPEEAAEEAEEGEEAEEPEEEPAEEEESSDPTLIEEAAQIIEEDDGEPAPEEEAEEPAVISEDENGDSEEISENFAIADVLQLVMDALAQEGESALEELPEEELLAEEALEEPVVFFTENMVKELSRITVTAIPSEGAFTEEVELNVVPIPAYSRVYQEAEAALEESGVEYDGMLAYDISFRSVATGEFIEPDAPVSVEMEITDQALAAVDSDNMDVESLMVTHIGSEETAAVADVADETDGSVTVSMNEDVVDGIFAEFVVDSFSTFVLTWTNAETGSTIHWGITDENGEFQELEEDSTVTMDTTASTLSLRNSISGYQYRDAVYCAPGETPADGVNIESIIYKTDDSWACDAIDSETGDVTSTAIADGSNIYVYYYVPTTPPGPAPTPETGEDPTVPSPTTTKTVEKNEDGTYTITLDIAGATVTEDNSHYVNVLVILDATTSMSGAKWTNAKAAVNTLIETMTEGDNAANAGKIDFALVTFGRSATVVQNWTKDNAAFKTTCANVGLVNTSGTNWEAGVRGGLYGVLNAYPEGETAENHDPTYVIFLTDGDPNTYYWITDDIGYSYRWNRVNYTVAASDVGDPNIYTNDHMRLGYEGSSATSADRAKDEVRAITGMDARLYGIYCFGGTTADTTSASYTRLDDVIRGQGQGGQKTIAATADTIESEFQKIAETALKEVGTSGVGVDDGVPSLSSVSSAVAGEAGGYEYFKGTKAEGDDEITWTKWTDAPGAVYSKDNGVTWDLSKYGSVNDGDYFRIKFTIWPSQEAYDTIADLNNGLISMTDAELDEAGIGYDEDAEGNRTYYLLTNTHLHTFYKYNGTSYSETPSDEDLPKEQMKLPTTTISVAKYWNNEIDSREAMDVELTVTKDGEDYYDVQMGKPISTGTHTWKQTPDHEIYISYGQITKTGSGYEVIEPGHEYTVIEPLNFSYRWDLTADVYRPMLVNGEETILIKTDSPTGTDGTDYYVIGGNAYKVVTGTTENVLVATNNRRSNLAIQKVVTVADAPADTAFPIQITLNNPNDPHPGEEGYSDWFHTMWFSVQTDPYDRDTVVKEGVTVEGATAEDGNTGFYWFDNGGTATVYLKAGQWICIANMAKDTVYTVTELLGEDMPDGFQFVKAESDAENMVDGETSTPATISDNVASGTIDKSNSNYTVVYSNTYGQTELTVTKEWNDGNNQDKIRPDDEAYKADISLLNGETALTDYDDNCTVTDNGDGTYTINYSDLPLYINNEEAEYKVKESTVPDGYEVSGSPAADGETITNTHAPETINVSVSKEWDDADDQDGIRPTSVSVQLKAGQSNVGDPITLDEDNEWTYTWETLPEAVDGNTIEYTVEEVKTTVITGTDGAGTYAIDIDGSMAEGYVITNTHTPEQTEVTVTKVWDDADDQDGIRPASISVRLYVGGVASDETVELNAENEWTNTWTGLDKYAGTTTPIAYSVDETAEPAGYRKNVTQAEDGSFDFTITNSHTPEETEVTVTKVWDDADNQDGIRPASISVQLKADGAAEGEAVELNEGNKWSYTWTELDKYAGTTTPIAYTVDETAVPDGYEKEVKQAEDGSFDFTITNSHTPEETEVTVTKVWEGDYKNVGKTRPASISVQLKADGAAEGEAVELKEDNKWTYTWENLPKYAGTTTPIVYTVDETEVPAGYEKEVKQAEDGSFAFTITNTYSAEPVSVDPPVRKVIEGIEDTDKLNKIFTFTIANTEAPEGVPVPMPEHTSITNSADYERKDKPGYYEFGVIEFAIPGTYTYTVTESGSHPCVTNDKESTKTITFTVTQNADGKLVVTPATDQVDLTFTNVYADVSVTVNKVWDDANNQDGKRPQSITVTLNNGDVVTLSEENKWSATINELPKFNANGAEIVYTWTEGDMPEGYSLTNTVREGEVTTLTNSYTPGTTSVSGFKTWNDEDNQDGKRPESITVNLLADGTPVQSKTVTAEDGWAWNFTGLPEYNSGTKITYKVEEAAVEGYEAAVDGYNITNTHAVEKIDVTVTKIWSDYDNGYGTRPQSITVQLYANGEVCGDPVTITAEEAGEDGNWTYTYTGLDKYSDGEEIVYTVTEDTVARYTTTIEGLVITNSYVRSKPEKDPKPPVENPDPPEPPIEEEPDEPVTEPDEPFAGYEEEPDEEIGEEPMPFSPYTGDDRHTAVWGLVSLLSLAGIVVVARKRREE